MPCVAVVSGSSTTRMSVALRNGDQAAIAVEGRDARDGFRRFGSSR